jgi:Ca2+-binding RTX toxin-like protein
VKLRGVVVSVATIGLMVAPAFARGVISSIAGARAECTITGTAAVDHINGTTHDDVICLKAGPDAADGLEGNDIIRGGQGDDGGPPHGVPMRGGIVRTVGFVVGLHGNDGSDVIKGQADDDTMEGDDQNDELYGGQGADCLGASCTGGAENGNDFLKSRDRVSGNDFVDGGGNTDTCRIDAGDGVTNCEL